jgi:hypothetical protein
MLHRGLRLREHANSVVARGDKTGVDYSEIHCYQQGRQIFFLNTVANEASYFGPL